MDTYQIPPDTKISYAHLNVANLDDALEFYQGGLGFSVVDRQGETVSLSATGNAPVVLRLTGIPGARPRPPHTTGLYHVAIRLPDRAGLSQTVQRLLEHTWQFYGAADHGVSEAFYTADPDGNGIELYTDRPRSTWAWQDDQVTMVTDPLDIDGILAAGWAGADSGLPPQTDVGHVHLQVADLERARAFYQGLLGLNVTQASYPGALFLAAGGYHHHVAVNVWAGRGATRPPQGTVGLAGFGLAVPDEAARRGLVERARVSGAILEELPNGAVLVDPDGNRVEIL